jgi:hypothetical protein
LDRRLGGLQRRSGRGGEEKNSQPLPGLEPPILQLVAQLLLPVLRTWEVGMEFIVIMFTPNFKKICQNV